jgi:hypothetical protein
MTRWKTPGVGVRIMFSKVRDAVLARTDNVQEPFAMFWLILCAAAAPLVATAVQRATADDLGVCGSETARRIC